MQPGNLSWQLTRAAVLAAISLMLSACDETLTAMSEGLGAGTAAERVAHMVEPWLS